MSSIFRRHYLILLLSVFGLLSPNARALEPNERYISLPTRPGVSQPILLDLPAGRVKGVALLFPGGNGVLGLTSGGVTSGLDNFVVRTRQLYAQSGIVACLVEVPSDHLDGIWNYRISANEAEDVAAVIKWIRSQWSVPIWAVGTSRGTISAANVSARLGNSGPDGMVLTSSVTTGDYQTLYDVPLKRISIPALLIHNRDDRCSSSPPSGARDLTSVISDSALQFVQGGLAPESGSCGGLSYHGFYGMEAPVVAKTINFLLSTTGRENL